MKFKDITISKLLKIIGVVNFVAVVVVAFMIFTMTSSYKEQSYHQDREFEFNQISESVSSASDYLTNEARLYVQTLDKAHYDNYWKEVNETKRREKAVETLKEMSTPQEYLSYLEQATQESANLAQIEDQAMKAVEQGNYEQAKTLMFDDNYEDYKDRISDYLVQFEDGLANYSASIVDRSKKKANLVEIILYIVIVFLVVNLTLSFLMIARKVRNLVSIKDEMDELAGSEGDLTKRMEFTSHDEIGNIGNSFNLFTEKVHEIVKEVHDNSVEISSLCDQLKDNVQSSYDSSEEISEVVEEIAKGATQQAKDTEDSALKVNEIGSALESDRILMEELKNLATEIEKKKDEGFKLLDTLHENMDRSGSDSKEIEEIVIQTNEYALNIESASQMIQSIADQTNLLALNAAIEAARAGEAGRGFAVVADNVRNLAEQSIGFAQEITSVIFALKERSQKAVETVKTLDLGIRESSGSAFDTQDKFNDISESLDKMKELVDRLENSSGLLQDKKVEVIDIVQNLSAIAQENAASTQQTTATIQEQASSLYMVSEEATELDSRIKNVLGVINKFKF